MLPALSPCPSLPAQPSEMEEEPINMNVDMEAPLEEELSRENAKKKTQLKTKKMKLQPPEMDGEALSGHVDVLNEDPRRIIVSLFEQSVENHFKAMDTIFKLCKGPDYDNFDREEVERLSSSVTFLREWRHFNYRPRIIRFSCETESSLRKDVIGETTLSQFSSASVPKMDGCEEKPLSLEDDEDFVMHVGGSVWALDWCPRVRQGCQGSQSHFTTEFIAVAAHPPESSYHKIGAPLTGRGLIQIWCLLNASIEDEDSSLQDAKRQKRNPSKGFNAKGKPGELPKKPRGRPRKQIVNESAENLDCKPRKLRGRPRKNPINEQAENSDLDSNPAEALTLQFPKDSGETKEKPSQKKKPRGRPRNTATNNEVKISLKLHGVSGKSDEHAAKGDMASKHNESICMPPASAHCVQALAVQFSEDLCNPKEKSSQTKKPRGRARQKPVNESVDNLDSNSQHDQAHVVRFPSTRGGSGDNTEHTASGNSIKQNDCQMPMASTHCIQALPVQFPEESHNTKEKSSKRKKSSGSAGKKPINESNDCQMPMASTHCIQVLPVQFTEYSPNTKEKSSKRKKSRGRAGKKPINVSTENVNCSSQYDQALAVRFTDNSSKLQCKAGVSGNSNEPEVSNDYSMPTASAHPRLKDKARRRGHNSGKGSPLLAQKEIEEASTPKSQMPSSCRQDIVASIEHFDDNGSMETNPNKETIPEDVALPRVVLCLAHNGKVAWDVKWRPCNACDAESKQRMGYLAVLLGNGALEVWEIPLPHAIRRIYPNFQKEDTDPRFMKLNPVFRCSMLKCGDRQSIPLTMEWSGSPHDFILAGCHDGVVALWKFSVNDSCKDTRPLLCFTADSAPIRGVAWAPVESDTEGKNVIVTAGHKGLKFWDLRDPFRPLWDLNPVQRIIYSLDWLPDPRCVIVSFDDGTMRILSLVKAAYDVPVTGRPFVGTQQQGFNSYYCSPFTIWSVHVSRLTGMVAYCGADGTVLRFQLTTRSVEKDPLRNRAPHFLCGSLVEEEESVLMVITPLPDVPHPMKKSLNEWGDTPRTIRGFLSVSNQAKRAIEQMAKTQSSYDHQTPALCYDDEPGTEIEPADDEKITAQKGKKAQKSKASSKKHGGKNKALVCIEEGEEKEDINKGEIENEIESFPPKIVAMHKVRWNMNKGSQRWLCYGGAAGILRCQKIKL